MKELFKIYAEATCGNQEAYTFLIAFHAYAHDIDDIVDGDIERNAENLVTILMNANSLYSTPFYLANSHRLSGVIAQVSSTWLDSVAWENAEEDWKQDVADVIRMCGNDVVTTVAGICGGFLHMRRISLRLRELAYWSQHEEEN